MRIRLNANATEVERIRKSIEQNDGYCPCKLQKNASTKCMCSDFLNQKELGPCHCGLYIKVAD